MRVQARPSRNTLKVASLLLVLWQGSAGALEQPEGQGWQLQRQLGTLAPVPHFASRTAFPCLPLEVFHCSESFIPCYFWRFSVTDIQAWDYAYQKEQPRWRTPLGSFLSTHPSYQRSFQSTCDCNPAFTLISLPLLTTLLLACGLALLVIIFNCTQRKKEKRKKKRKAATVLKIWLFCCMCVDIEKMCPYCLNLFPSWEHQFYNRNLGLNHSQDFLLWFAMLK